jgi:hypothetical protein
MKKKGEILAQKKRKEKKRHVSSGHAPEKESRGDNRSNLGLV